MRLRVIKETIRCKWLPKEEGTDKVEVRLIKKVLLIQNILRKVLKESLLKLNKLFQMKISLKS